LGKLKDKTRRPTVQSTEKLVPPTSMMLATQLAESQRTSYASSLSRGLATDKSRSDIERTVFPTLLVIAPDGTLQGIYLGYRLTLREDLTSCIRGLLKKQSLTGAAIR
jgi:hypothetical protein